MLENDEILDSSLDRIGLRKVLYLMTQQMRYALSFEFDALALGMDLVQMHAHGKPLLFMGIRGRNEAHTLKIR